MQKGNAKLKAIIFLQAIAMLLLLYKFKQSSIIQGGVSQIRETRSQKSSDIEIELRSNHHIQTTQTKKSNTHEVEVRESKPSPLPTLNDIGDEQKNITKHQTVPEIPGESAEVTPDHVLNNYLSYPDMKPLELSCKTCAFVASSGHLRGKGLGAEIDSKDCVFRSNDAPIAGYEADVGSQTTIRTVDKRSLNFLVENYLKNETNYPCLKETVVIYVKVYEIEEVFSNAAKMIPFLKTYYISKKLFQNTSDLFKVEVLNSTKIEKGQWTSNGFATIAIARDICNEIHVYGITEPNHCEKVARNLLEDVPYHYYKDPSRRKECDFFNINLEAVRDHHSFTKEKIALKNLQQKWDNIFFHAPEWKKKARKINT